MKILEPAFDIHSANLVIKYHVFQQVDAAGNKDPVPAAYTWSVYGEEMYNQYMQLAGFSRVDATPLTYEPKGVEYIQLCDDE